MKDILVEFIFVIYFHCELVLKEWINEKFPQRQWIITTWTLIIAEKLLILVYVHPPMIAVS